MRKLEHPYRSRSGTRQPICRRLMVSTTGPVFGVAGRHGRGADRLKGHTDRVDVKVMLRVTRVAITGLVMSMLGLSACVDDTMTNRLEETYGIADFEIEGAERHRTEHNRVSTREGPTGITQRFEPLGETELDDILASALAAAEADGWEMQPPVEGSGVNLWIGYRPVAETDGCDVLSVSPGLATGHAIVELKEGRCQLGQ